MEPCSQTDRILRIEKSVDEIGDKVSQIAGSVDILVVKITPFIEKVSEHDRALRGSNGDVGIVANVSDIRNTIKEWADNQKWLFRLVVGWLITTAIGGVYYLITVAPHP